MDPKNYFIKEGYTCNEIPAVYRTKKKAPKVIWQPDVYDFAFEIARRSGATHIVDVGSGSGEKLMHVQNEFNLVICDYGNKATIENNLRRFEHVHVNLEEGFPSMEGTSCLCLSQAVVICSDVVEHLRRPDALLRGLTEAAQKAKAVVISTPDRDRVRGLDDCGPPENRRHVREWNLHEFSRLLDEFEFNPSFIGWTRENNMVKNPRKTIIAAVNNTGLEISPQDYIDYKISFERV